MGLFSRRQKLSPDSDEPGDRWVHLPISPVPDVASEHSKGVPEHGLVRSVWTDQDFAWMGWQDATLWAIEVQTPEDSTDFRHGRDRVALDLDYITRWVDPRWPRKYLTFWVAPCTLVFSGVTELELTLSGAGPHEIQDIYPVRSGWHIEGHDGCDLKMAATGFRQTFRRPPVHVDGQRLELAARGGYCFSEEPWDL